VTQEFQLSITPVGPDTYWLRTEEVAPGVPLAEAQVTWPLETWLAQANALFQDPLHTLLTTAADPAALPPETPWTQLGQALYSGLFQGRIRDSWVAAQGVAQNRRQPLRLRLGFKDSRVQRLPWELLYGDDRPLSTGLDVTLCRYYQGQAIADAAPMPPLPVGMAVRVLVVISGPTDQESLALFREVQALVESLDAAPVAAGTLAIEHTLLEQPGRAELVQALEQGNFHVLHYAGHSDAGDTGGDLLLVNRQTGLSEGLSGEDLAGLLVNNGVRLAVFNSCRGAYTAQDDAQASWRDQNLVQALVNRGMPAVIAMADRILDDVALTFTQLLYRNLREGYPIDLCLSRVRQGLMSAYGSGQPCWMLPLLYLRPGFDGYLQAGDRPSLEADLSGDLLTEDLLTEAGLLEPEVDADLERAGEPPPGEGAEPDLYAWLGEGDGVAAEAGTVANLVDQLSHSISGAPVLAADPAENLLPQPAAASAELPQLPSLPLDNAAPPPAVHPLMATKRWTLPANPWIWGGLGLAGLTAVLALALTTLSTANRPTPGDAPAPPAVLGDGPTVPPGNGAALLQGALQAIALGNTDTARRLIDQMLDANDLTTAAAAVASIPADQQTHPDLAYVRGRLAWQQLATGTTEATAYDARRAWIDATDGRPDFVDAWVALGFAHYALGDKPEAIAAWERAIALDQRQRRDIDPNVPQVAYPLTTYAYAGLAMAYQDQSSIAIVPQEQAQLRQQAQGVFRQAIALDPTLTDVNRLALHWLWVPPPLLSDWQTVLRQLPIDGGTLP
jgi:tetratricopeptide (TPR) repeat protein